MAPDTSAQGFLDALIEKGLTDREMYLAIRKAILAVTLNQEYSAAGWTVKRPSLESLLKAEQMFGKRCGALVPESRKVSRIVVMDD